MKSEFEAKAVEPVEPLILKERPGPRALNRQILRSHSRSLLFIREIRVQKPLFI
jgi:hypothetical protein